MGFVYIESKMILYLLFFLCNLWLYLFEITGFEKTTTYIEPIIYSILYEKIKMLDTRVMKNKIMKT